MESDHLPPKETPKETNLAGSILFLVLAALMLMAAALCIFLIKGSAPASGDVQVTESSALLPYRL
jgi:hypothetical protein